MTPINMVAGLLWGLAGFLVFGTVVPFWKGGTWWVRVCDFPRVQIVVAQILCLAGLLALGEGQGALQQAGLAVLGLAMIYQLVRIVPYTPLYATQVQTTDRRAGGTLRVLIANVLMPNRNAETLIEQVRALDPDVFMAAETDQWWVDQLSVLKDDLPEVIAHPLDNTYGIVLFSKRPLEEAEVNYLVEDDVPSIRATMQLGNGQRFRFTGLHPRPPRVQQNSDHRDTELMRVAYALRGKPHPGIVAGDMNDVAWSDTTRLFQKVSGYLDPRIGRGMFNTFHAGYPVLRYPLDHVFVSPHWKVVELRRLSGNGSDHFPIYIELHLDPSAVYQQEGYEATQEDLEEAAEKAIGVEE
ncbi:MAG: endonuclease/exonuclease/phosphatase family protein [Bacteroidota bacterium]